MKVEQVIDKDKFWDANITTEDVYNGNYDEGVHTFDKEYHTEFGGEPELEEEEEENV